MPNAKRRRDGSSSPTLHAALSPVLAPQRPLDHHVPAHQPAGAEVTFQLTADRKSYLFPHDVANMAMWCLPHPVDETNEHDPVVPAVECPKWLGIRNKSSIEAVLVVYCNGISYEDLLGSDENADTKLCMKILGPVRRNECGGVSVQFAPLYVRNTQDRLAEEFFCRNAKTSRPLATPAGSSCASALQAAQRKLRCPQVVEDLPAPSVDMGAAGEDKEQQDSRDKKRDFSQQGDVLNQLALVMPSDGGVLREMGYVLAIPASADSDDVTDWKIAVAGETGGTDGASLPLVVAFDCEMVEVDGDRCNLALARATLVDASTGDCIFDHLVKPRGIITDYLTRYSGITEEMLEPVTRTLQDVQDELLQVLATPYRAVYVVGHSLENDFRTCHLVLGAGIRVLDTAHLFPHPQGLPYKNALRHLAAVHLRRKIQHEAHDSQEDAMVCVELLDLKLIHGPDYGTTPRVSILSLLPLSPHSHQPYAKVVLLDTPNVLKYLLSGCPASISGSAQVVSEGTAGDADACRRAARALRQHQHVKPAGQRPRLVWVQIHKCHFDLQQHSSGEEASRQVDALNDGIVQVIDAAPLQTLVIIMAASCKAGGANRLSQAHGGVFAFVKNRPCGGGAGCEGAGCAAS